MNVYEVYFKVYLLKNIGLKDVQREIYRIIDITLGKTEDTLRFHNKNEYKNYCFNSFYPIERDGVYKEGRIYTIVIRTIDKSLFTYLNKNLPLAYTPKLRGLKTEIKIINKNKIISKLYSITSLVIKNDDGYWKNIISEQEFTKRLRENLIKKYNSFTKQEINEDFKFIKLLEFNNKKPISNYYKGRNILGDKITIEIEENEQAQNIAYMALGTGMGEMNARGLGYMGYKWKED